MKIYNSKSRVCVIVICILCFLLGFARHKHVFLFDRVYQGYFRTNTLQIACQPLTNVMFLKTHKTGSSTILNIMFRFTEKHNISIALPAKHVGYFNYPQLFQAKFVAGFRKKQPGYRYNIICNHMKFNLPEIQKIMPNNTVYVSILRNPISLLESSFSYFRFLTSFKKSKNLNEFLAFPQKYYDPKESFQMLVKNTMWYDFGYDNNAEDSDSYVQTVLQEMEQRFQLLLINEYFDESMVLLKNTLCWDMDDVVYFKLNSRSNESVQSLTEASKEKAKEWCSLDWKLYQHFNRTFWRRIHETIGPEKMKKELELMRSKQKQIREICLEEGEAVGKAQIKDSKLQPAQAGVAHILGYNVRQDLDSEMQRVCQTMVMPEHKHTLYMHHYQYQHEITTT